MYEFHCGSPVCNTEFSAPTKDELMREVAEHVRVKHRLAEPSRSIVAFLEANTVREVVPAVPAG